MFTQVAAFAPLRPELSGLDVCGVDVMCESVHRPWKTKDGGVVEVDAAPGCMLSPSGPAGRNVGRTGGLAAGLEVGRDGLAFHVVAVTGTNVKTTTARLTAHPIAIAVACGHDQPTACM